MVDLLVPHALYKIRDRTNFSSSLASIDNLHGRLEALLAAQQWQEADQQTTDIILRESNWGISTWKVWGAALLSGKLTGWNEPIKQYLCHDLETLVDLWLKFSDGRFGLSVQQQIFGVAQ